MVMMKFITTLEGAEHTVVVDNHDSEIGLYTVTVGQHAYRVNARSVPSSIVTALINNKSFDIDLDRENNADSLDGKIAVRVRGRVVRLEMLEERRKKMKDAQLVKFSHEGVIRINSPMPGKVLRHLVTVGESVKEGQGLVVVEAMKMENELQAPKDGTIKEIMTKVGTAVDSGTTLMIMD